MQEIEEFEIQKVPLNTIKFDESNPNKLSQRQMNSLAKIMEKYGYLVPIILNKDHTIIDGEHRVRIYQNMGRTHIQAYIIDVDTIDLKILRQLMNKLRGEHDKQKDALEFKSIFEAERLDEFSQLLAKDRADFERILETKFDIQFHKEETDIPEIPANTNIQLGDIYQLGNHRIICGDCTDLQNYQRLMGEKMVDSLISDPPYGVDYANKNAFLNTFGKANHIETPINNDSIHDYRQFFSKFLSIIRFSEYNTVFITMSGKELVNLYLAMIDQKITWGDFLVWVKNNHVLGRKDYNAKHEFIIYGWKGKHKFYANSHRTTVLEFKKPHTNNLHPTMKPLELLRQLIQDGTEKEMIVYDPFLGSGSTLIACEQTNRVCYGMELDPHYVDVIIQRWENYTGKKSKKL